MPSKNSVRSGLKMAKKAAKVLRKATNKTIKQLAGGVLSNRRRTSKR